MGDFAQDLSTLAMLQPGQLLGVEFKRYRTSSRLQGSHRMALMRPSRLPESSRAYVPGDPINLIDWKAFGRTDHLLVREIRDEATARVRIIMDLGDSMQWPREHVEGIRDLASKAEIAIRCALNLAYMHHRIGDAVELGMILPGQSQIEHFFCPRSGSDILSLYEELVSSKFFATKFIINSFATAARERSVDLVYWLGDALGPVDYRSNLGRGRMCVMVHVLSSLELAIDWIDSDTSYFDADVMQKEYQGSTLRSHNAYQSRLTQWCAGVANNLANIGGEYMLVNEQSTIANWQSFVSSLSLKIR